MFSAMYWTTASAKENEAGFLKFVNDGNLSSYIARFVVYKNDHVSVEAWFPDHYERRAFGAFFEEWLEEIELFTKGDVQSRKYLK